MAVMKCKMCGGDLEFTAGTTVAECEFCRSKQTLPKGNEEIIQNLFNRANLLRLKCEFDKAEQMYEKILQEDPTEAEAHWGIVLCKYGIEYVEDPKTFRRIPTCHRTSYDAVTTDADYLAAIEQADAAQKAIYEAEAKTIDGIQKNILSIVKDEKPFDVFLCYKESDENGKRTVDSTVANDIYYQLTQEGLKVFYAAITLEDKLGQEYEPYIFAALNSAKVMLVIGTKPQYFTAVWVKNEWSRFLKLMKTDRSKLLIPCYRDMDAYELPEEFAHLQAQDMSKIGFINDVVRGIKKVTVKDEPKKEIVKETVVTGGNANTAPLLKRAFMFLEDGKWDSADEYCEKVLDIDPENAMAYVGKLMANLRVRKQESLKDCANPFNTNEYYQKAVRFADDDLKSTLTGYITHIKTRNENKRLATIYLQAKEDMATAKTESAFKKIAAQFESIPDYSNSAQLAKECYEKAEIARKDWILTYAQSLMAANTIPKYKEAIKELKKIPGWKDADERITKCEKAIADLEIRAEQERIARAERAEKDRLEMERIAQYNKKRNIMIAAVAVVVAIILIFVLVLTKVIIPNGKYDDAVALMDTGNYTEAIAAFEALDGYKDSDYKIEECHIAILDNQYNSAMDLLKARNYTEAIAAFKELDNYKDSADQIMDCRYFYAVELMNAGNFEDAIAEFKELDGYKDSYEKIEECKILPKYNNALSLKDSGETAKAAMLFGTLGDYQDAKQQSMTLWEQIAIRETIDARYSCTVGLKANGTAVAVGNNHYGQCAVSGWKNIVAISAGYYHTVGLRADGTVVATKYTGDYKHYDGQGAVSIWKDIVAISAATSHTVGLKADGTVVAVGSNNNGQCNVSGWKDIVAISAERYQTIGLKADGTVVATGSNNFGACDVSDWTDIVAISAGVDHTVGLKADGTVVATKYTGNYDYGQCDVSDWTDIVAISTSSVHTVGLKADGTVVATKYTGKTEEYHGQCEVSGWTDIVAISAGYNHTVGLKADGTVVATTYIPTEYGSYSGQCDVSDWTNIAIPDKKNP